MKKKLWDLSEKEFAIVVLNKAIADIKFWNMLSAITLLTTAKWLLTKIYNKQ